MYTEQFVSKSQGYDVIIAGSLSSKTGLADSSRSNQAQSAVIKGVFCVMHTVLLGVV